MIRLLLPLLAALKYRGSDHYPFSGQEFARAYLDCKDELRADALRRQAGGRGSAAA